MMNWYKFSERLPRIDRDYEDDRLSVNVSIRHSNKNYRGFVNYTLEIIEFWTITENMSLDDAISAGWEWCYSNGSEYYKGIPIDQG